MRDLIPYDTCITIYFGFYVFSHYCVFSNVTVKIVGYKEFDHAFSDLVLMILYFNIWRTPRLSMNPDNLLFVHVTENVNCATIVQNGSK